MPFPRASTALSRFTVLDLTRVRAGPTCERQLADWGANVVKIETPEHMESGEPLGGPRQNADFMNLHRNKRSLTLNLKTPEGVAVLKRLVEQADGEHDRLVGGRGLRCDGDRGRPRRRQAEGRRGQRCERATGPVGPADERFHGFLQIGSEVRRRE